MTVDFVIRALADAPFRVAFPSPLGADEARCHVATAHVPALARLAIAGLRAELILITAEDRRLDDGAFHVHYIFALGGGNVTLHASTRLDTTDSPAVPSLASICFPASRFERELHDLFGIVPIGHPDLRPLVKHGFWPEHYFPLRKDVSAAEFADDGRPFPFTAVGGEGVYEIPVGPVHAGVIEPGHFRFSVMGETIIDLKTRLYFTHKGVEKLFEGRPLAAAIELAERISGDTTIGHGLAFCQAVEAASRVEVPPRAVLVRVALLELERLYNHVADVGAILNDTGFAIANAHCLRIRETLLRLNKRLTGSRLLRGALAIGGLARDLEIPDDLPIVVDRAMADFDEVLKIALNNTLVLDRLEGTGVLSADLAKDYGVLGYVARASGRDIDIRRDRPSAGYGDLEFVVPVERDGDVKARTVVRVREAHESARLVRQVCSKLKPGLVNVPASRFHDDDPAVGIVEGWRGRIVHWIQPTTDGVLRRVKIVDPSFFNWPALSQALVGNIVPDFPLCNKSFNQSYAGNDL